MNDNKIPSCGPTRKEKHIELHQAIIDVCSVISHLKSLTERIRGAEPKDPECLKTNDSPTLSEVLNHGAGALRETTSEIHSIIDALEEALF